MKIALPLALEIVAGISVNAPEDAYDAVEGSSANAHEL
jgi:hypothetical protein